ncbi:hypothetical protein R8Z50_16100 [Longispora sp. K20-0274]|uniref:hypothetical protein n=1 Tax=Longispora sp. K20-0274 TaxID=3088255 RepID=UPI00399C1A0B
MPPAGQIVVDPSRITPIGDSAGLPLPVDPYLWSAAENDQLRRAEDLLIARCVAGFGLVMPPTPRRSDVGPATATSRRYGLTSATEAAATGYRLAGAPTGPQPAPEPAATGGELNAVLEGGSGRVRDRPVPAGGCRGEADRRLGDGAQLGVADVAQDVNGHAWEMSRTHPLVTAAFAAWSRCMAAAGVDYPDPMAAMNDSRFVGTPTATEIAVARADVACKVAGNTTGIWYAVEADVQRALIAANGPALDAARRAKSEQLGHAREVLAAGP